MYRYPTKPKMSLIQNPEKTFRWGQVQCLMDKTTDKQILGYLMGGRATYCCYEYYWTRSKEKAFTDWLEYMEKCIEMANKYSKNVSWEDDEDDGNWVEPTEFEEFTYHGTKFWKNTDGKCQWFYEYDNGIIGWVGDELGIYTSDDDLEFSDGEGKNAGDYVPVLYWGRLVGENLVLHGKGFGYNTKFGVHPVAKLIKRLRIRPMIATADSRAHEIISHRAKYGNAPLFENNIVFGNFFSREQFSEEVQAYDYFDEFQEHIHELGRQGHFNELMKEYFEEWLETNQ
tara:strand:+ start:821 stop:1675 length:855 start_codon:yes stop_codon:yes gene_type:complete